MSEAHEAYDLFTRLQEALPKAVKDDGDVIDALDVLEDALTSYDRAAETSVDDIIAWAREAMQSRSNGLAEYLEIPEGSVIMAVRDVDSPVSGKEFTITIGSKQFLLSITPSTGTG